MDGKVLARMGAIVFVAVAITAAIIEMTREDEPVQPLPFGFQAQVDPCARGSATVRKWARRRANDAGCLAIWAENPRPLPRPDAGAVDAWHQDGERVNHGRHGRHRQFSRYLHQLHRLAALACSAARLPSSPRR
jgi:conjugative transfer region protein TrbK